jgi:hypothetical protein
MIGGLGTVDVAVLEVGHLYEAILDRGGMVALYL